MAYSDNVLTGRAFALKRRETIDSNQEFVALGAANIASSLASGFPVSSSGSRTVLADAMGARTPLHSLVSVVVLVATMLWLGPLLATSPPPPSAASSCTRRLRLIDVAELRRITAFRHSELVLSLSTTAAVLVLGVLPGIGVALVLSLLDLLRRIVHPHDGVLGYVQNWPGCTTSTTTPTPAGAGAPRLPLRLPAVLRQLPRLREARPPSGRRLATGGAVEWFLLNAEANTEVDLTAVDALDTLRITLQEDGIDSPWRA